MFGFSTFPQNVTVTEAYSQIGAEGHVLIDVRTHDEAQDISVPGSHHIPLDSLPSQIAQIAHYTSIHVMCRSGGRSAMATKLLYDAGLTHAKNVSGGILAWESGGLPTV